MRREFTFRFCPVLWPEVGSLICIVHNWLKGQKESGIQAAQTDVAVLAGGGIDSSLCIHLLSQRGNKVRPLHIDYGQPAALHEWQAVQRIAEHFLVVPEQISIKAPLPICLGEVPGRNAALIFLALMHLRSSERLICIGIHAGTPFYDCSQQFFAVVERLVAEQTDSRVRLVAPLLDLHKPEIVTLARANAIPLDATYSCQIGSLDPCGECWSCKDRKALGC